MTVLVTGACGLLGGHVVDVLRDAGRPVRGLAMAGEATDDLTGAGVDVRVGDVTVRRDVEAAVDGVETVIHCAARTGPWGPEDAYRRTNVEAVETLLRAATAAGVRRIVHVSSVTVHGNDVRGGANEDAPLRGEPNPYSRTKVEAEHLIARLLPEVAPVTIVRPGWIYGPRDVNSFGRTASMVRDGRMIMIGPGTNHLPLIEVTDVARGVVAASTAEVPSGRAYILVNDERVTQREYLDAIARALGVDPPKRRIPYRAALAAGAGSEMVGRLLRRDAPPPLMRYGVQMWGGENRFSILRARRELGFAPRVRMAEGVERSVAWFRAATDAPEMRSV